jgi:peptidoglycan/LPS O-acetylase OafA/YrhL
MSSNNKLSILGLDLSNRVYGLDILRTYAVCLVLLVHTNELLPESVNTILSYFISDGVTVFFTLSGFLIGNILIKTFEKQKISLGVLANFWCNRWMRTLPLYYFILIVSILLYDNDLTFVKIIRYVFFMQNLKIMISDYFYSVSWSLSIEEWFYFITPIALFLINSLCKIKIKYSFLITILFFVICTNCFRLYRYYDLVYNLGRDPNWYLFSTWYFKTPVITRLDSVMYGVLGAYCYSYNVQSWFNNKFFKLLLGLALIFLSPYITKLIFNDTTILLYENVFSYMIQGIGVLFLIPFLQSVKKGKGSLYQIITFISIISYSMYLTHALVKEYLIVYISRYIYLNSISQFILIWVLSILISSITYKYIEKPGIDLRKRILKKE